MYFHGEIGSLACSFYHRLKAMVGEWCTALAHEHKGRTADLALQAPERPQLATGQRMRCWGALFDSPDVQDSVVQIDLLPPRVHQF
jgi:hypothetical protein